MTDEEILYRYIDLSESHLTRKEQEEVMDLIVAYSTFSEKGDQLQKRDIIFLFDIWCCIFFFDL